MLPMASRMLLALHVRGSAPGEIGGPTSLEIFGNVGKREGRSVSVIAIDEARIRMPAGRGCERGWGRAMLFWWRREAGAAEYLFYDGHCGLCHRAVKFVLRHDRSGKRVSVCAAAGRDFSGAGGGGAAGGIAGQRGGADARWGSCWCGRMRSCIFFGGWAAGGECWRRC